LTALLKKHGAWAWDFADGKWVRFTDSKRLYPGIRILLRSAAGGYTETRGWSPHLALPVQSIDLTTEEEDSSGRDNRSFGVLQTLEEHTNEVVDELQALLKSLSPEVKQRYAVGTATRETAPRLRTAPPSPAVVPPRTRFRAGHAAGRRERSRRLYRRGAPWQSSAEHPFHAR